MGLFRNSFKLGPIVADIIIASLAFSEYMPCFLYLKTYVDETGQDIYSIRVYIFPTYW